MDLPRGMRDIGSEEMRSIEHVRREFARIAGIYGFDVAEPSPLEMLSVLETKSGPDIRDEIYHFEDKAKRQIALRFDFTVGLTRRMAASKSEKLPSKVASFGGVWRYDEPQKGRYRYFHQWNMEVYGRPGTETDAEIIEASARLFEALGIDIRIELSHREIAEALIRDAVSDAVSDADAAVSDMLRAMDKSQKRSREDIISEFSKKGYDPAVTGRVLEFAGCRGTPDEIEDVFAAVTDAAPDAWKEIRTLWDSLENRGVADARINLGIVRGLDYYSGMVFEVYGREPGAGALAGGGRYDALPGAFGRSDIGAAGAAGGVERMVSAMQDGRKIQRERRAVSVAYVNQEMLDEAVRISSRLRASGIPTGIDLGSRHLKKQMEQAAESEFCIIVGPREIKENAVTLRNMRTGEERRVALDDILGNPGAYISP